MNKDTIINELATSLMNGIGISRQLIEYYGDSIFEEELINFADDILYKKLIGKQITVFRKDKAIVTVAVTYLALKAYDGSLWPHVQNSFKRSYSVPLPISRIDGLIRNIIAEYKDMVGYYNSDSYIAVPAVLAGVTHYWLPSFFNFCFKIYQKRFLADRDINDSDLENQFYHSFLAMRDNKYLSFNDHICFGEANYDLSQYTQYALMNDNFIHDISHIAADSVRIIVNYLNDCSSKEVPPFYQDAFNIWKNDYEFKPLLKKELEGTRGKGIWKSSFKFSQNGIALITKTRWIDDSYTPKDVRLKIFNGSKLLCDTDDIDIETDDMGAYIIQSKKFYLNNLNVLGSFSYSIDCLSNSVPVICQDELYRDIIFFDENGNEIYADHDYSGIGFVVLDHMVDNFNGTLLYCDQYNYVYQFEIKPNETYFFNDVGYSFRKTVGAAFDAQIVDWIYAELVQYGKHHHINIYNNIRSFVFETSVAAENLAVLLNDKIRFFEFNWLLSYGNGVNRYSLNIDNHLDIGYNEICIVNKTTGEIIPHTKMKFIFDDKLGYDIQLLDDPNKCCRFIFKSSLIWDDKVYEVDRYSRYIEERITNVKGLNNVALDIKINPMVDLISVNGTDWNKVYSRLGFNLIEKNNYKLFIKPTKSCFVNVIIDKNIMPLTLKKVDDTGWIYYADISFLKTYKDGQNSCVIQINNDNSLIFYVDFVTHVNPSKSYIEYNKLTMLCEMYFDFDSSKELFLQVVDKHDNIIKSKSAIKGCTTYYDRIYRPFEKYKIQLYEKCGFLLSEKYRLVYEKQFVYGDSAFLGSKKLIVKKVEVDGFDGPRIMKLNYKHAVTDISLKLTRHTRYSDCYFGKLSQLVEGEDGHIYDKYKNLHIEQVLTDGEFDGEYIWVYMYEDDSFDTLLYDEENSTISETTDINNPRVKRMESINKFLIKIEEN